MNDKNNIDTRGHRLPVTTACRRLMPMLCMITITLYATAVRAQVIGLDSLLDLIERRSPALAEYDSRANALEAFSEGAGSWKAPMTGVGTYMTPYAQPGEMTEARDRGAIMFSIEQPIPSPGRANAARRYSRSQAAIQRAGRSWHFNTLRAQARTYYANWLVAEKKVRALREGERIVELILKVARIRYPYNQGTLSDVYQAEARLAKVKNDLLATRASIEGLRARLKALAHLSANDPLMIDTTLTIEFDPARLARDTAMLSARRSDLRKIERSVASMRFDQELRRYDGKPDFRIRFDHMEPVGNMPAQFSAMVMVSIPVAPWSAKGYRAEVKGLEYEIDAMKHNQEAILIEAKGTLVQIARQIGSVQQQLENYRKAILPALRKNYQTLMLAYEENHGALPMVIGAWDALNTAQLEYLGKEQEYYQMIIDYEKEIEQ